MARLAPWPLIGSDRPSSSQWSVAQSSQSAGSTSSSLSSDEQGEDIHAVVQDLDVTRQALHMESQEAERLWSRLSAVEMALTAAG